MDLVRGYYRLKDSVGRYFAELPITTNMYSFMILIPAFVGFFLLVFQQVFLAGALMLISGFFDLIDGSVARRRKKVTAFGAWFADFADKGAETCLLFGISFIFCGIPYLEQNFAILLLFVLGFMFSYIKPHGFFWKSIKEKDQPIIGLDRNSRLGLVYLGLMLYPLGPSYLGWTILLSLAISFIKLLQSMRFLLPRVAEELSK